MTLRSFYIYLLLFSTSYAFAQDVVYQDIFQGGVTGGGYHPSLTTNPGVIDIYIDPGSVVRKAFLIIHGYNDPPSRTLNLNGYPIELNVSHKVGSSYFGPITTLEEVSQYLYDITDLISPSDSIVTINPPYQQLLSTRYFADYYIIVAYENQSLPIVNPLIIINIQNTDPDVKYIISGLNSIDTLSDFCFAIQSCHICDTLTDGTSVFIENNYIGIIGGADKNKFHNCTGVTGSFVYQNNLLQSISDDTNDSVVGGSDGLANIKSYITSLNSISFNLKHQSSSNAISYSNFYNQFYLAYSTPCDTFSINGSLDTTICQGESVQLNAGGGVKYKWFPNEAISNDTIPNPIVSPEKSTTYIGTVTSAQGCHRTLMARVYVNQPPDSIDYQIKAPNCGLDNGSITADSIYSNWSYQYLSLNNGPFQTNKTFNDIGKGSHIIQLKDTNGCQVTDTLFVDHQSLMYASFRVDPHKGRRPLTVNFYNQSEFATHYLWLMDNRTYLTSDPVHTFEIEGEYPVKLIAYDRINECSDTAQVKVTVESDFDIVAPNVFSPDNDGKNDRFYITIQGATAYKGIILNRWGQIIHEESETNLEERVAALNWNGLNKKNEMCPEGVYFYTLEITTSSRQTKNYQGEFHLFR